MPSTKSLSPMHRKRTMTPRLSRSIHTIAKPTRHILQLRRDELPFLPHRIHSNREVSRRKRGNRSRRNRTIYSRRRGLYPNR
jgi:hypothetical protein